MRQSLSRIISRLLVAALIVTLLPVASLKPVAAEPSVYFNFKDFSTSESAPTEVNTNVIELAGTFNGVTSLSFRVEKIVNGAVVEASNGSTQPIITNGNNFRFSGVSIYDGLNRLKVLGVNNSGNVVSGEAYVNFSNVPVISDVKLTDGRVLPEGAAIVSTRANETVSVKAPNATEVTINGTQMFGGGGSTYILNNLGLQKGYNKLVILAKNATKTYELTRYIVYYNGDLTAYNVTWGTNPTNPMDGNPTYGTALSGEINAKVILDSAVAAPTFQVDILAEDKTTVITSSAATYVPAETVKDTASGYSIYSIKTSGLSFSTNGKFFIRVRDTSVTGSPYFLLPFSYRNSSSAFIKDIKQIYGVTEGSSVSYTSSASFNDNTTVTTAPLWVMVESGNNASGAVAVTAKQNGVAVGNPEFTYTTYSVGTATDLTAIKIDNMPAGEVELTFAVPDSTSPTDTIKRKITFVPAPSIQVSTIYYGQVFESSAEFENNIIKGRLYNFNLNASAPDQDSVYVSLNGKKVQVGKNNIDDNDGTFTFDPKAAGFALLPGSNDLVFEGIANGVPVTTKFVIYYFSKDNPAIQTVRPVPYVIDPGIDTDLKRLFNDPELKFAPTDDNQFTTTEKTLDLLFDVKDLSSLDLLVNGVSLGTAVVDSVGKMDATTTAKGAEAGVNLYIEDPTTNKAVTSLTAADFKFKLRLAGYKLPQSGNTNFTIVVRKGTTSVTQTITVIRDLSPYIVLSPRLPNQSVINSNFLKISIKAEGADKVLIGKVEMTKGEGDIFRYEMKNLKAGVNTIKFTVQTGTQKTNGQFSVNYAADNSLGAQYKAKLASSGKFSIFKGELSLTFPKNTFLRQANVNPGQDVKTIDLFDAQELYFGIADRADGRTVKRYNGVGEKDVDGNFRDGELIDVPYSSDGANLLIPKVNFDYASNLFWIDAGYFKGTGLVNDYQLIDAKHPYETSVDPDDLFYARVRNPGKWLEPSQRGTITIKYDANIRDTAARYLSVWRYTSTGWENVGGVVNTSAHTVTAPFYGFGYYTVMSMRYSFSDIVSHDYARLALEAMFAHGIMKNKDNNSFGVYDNITRGEFAQMLVKMLDIPLEYNPNNMTFDDVLPIDFPDALWNYRYVETAVKKGFIRGRSPKLFLPNDPLTRQEAAIMIARALNLVKNNADLVKDKAALQKLFTDANQAEYYGMSSILVVTKAGYITGIPNTAANGSKPTYRFEPNSMLSRADAAVIAERVMKKLKKL